MYQRAIIWAAWGEKYVNEAIKSFNAAKSHGYSRSHGYSSILVTDEATFEYARYLNVFDYIIKADFKLNGLSKKSEIWDYIPKHFNSYLFLDTDTRVLGCIDFGFEMAEKWGMAIVPAAHYCLDYFWGFDKIMKNEGVSLNGQMQYNSGVIFFSFTEKVISVFEKWKNLATKYDFFDNDQPFLTLAMELVEFRPYVLSLNYNYRGMRVPIIGNVRIWHSYHEPPKELNDQPWWWPMRYFVNGKFYRPGFRKWKLKQYLKKIIDLSK